MHYSLRTLLIVLATTQIVASVVASGYRLTPMASVACYAILLLLAVGFTGLPAESSKPLYRLIGILTVCLALAAFIVQLALGI
ncbi:MAG: hypothetical protein L0211_16935 [Planctomycetaceae bacterium]|nr:hypothetical protein [Planctomycetaceae bacterium]